jgi:hypothetical protein
VHSIKKLEASRDKWKKTAKKHRQKHRNESKKVKRRDQEITKLKSRVKDIDLKIKELENQNEALSRPQAPPQSDLAAASNPQQADDLTRLICLMLILWCRVSFRSVPKILEVFNLITPQKLWVPHFTSVINWIEQVGLAKLKAIGPITEPWAAIVDCSISIGNHKLLVILRTPLDALGKAKTGLSLEDCECIYIEVLKTTTSEIIKNSLAKAFAQAGNPTLILSDRGADLKKGISLMREIIGKSLCFAISDIGHFCGTALKAEFNKNPLFLSFISKVNRCASKLRQTQLAFLLPPKLRTVGRFQSIGRVAKWAKKIQLILNTPGRAAEGSVKPNFMRP